MALTKRGSRILTVDGVEYRWRIRRQPTYDQGNGYGTLLVAVELAAGGGSVLVADTGRKRPDVWWGEPGPAVTPVGVTRIVRAALDRGWRPELPGKQFRLGAARFSQA